MKLTHNGLSALLAGSLLVCSACHKKQTLPVMVPPAVTRTEPQTVPKQPPPPPDIPPSQSGTTVKPPPNVVTTETPPPPPKKKKRVARKHNNAAQEQTAGQSAAPAADAQGAAAQPANAQPQQSTAVPLRQLMSEDTRKQYDARIKEALDNARATLQNALARSNLTPAQKNMAAQVDTFVRQAQDAQNTDIEASRSLAERAELLAHDLADTLK